MAEKTKAPEPAAPKGAGAPAASKMDGVRRALIALGPDATPTRIQSYLRDEFGIQMTLEHISNYKGKELRRRGGEDAAAPPAAESKANNPPSEGAPPGPPSGNAAGALTKGEAVRRALRELGVDAGRADLQAFVKDRFGIEVSLDHISTTRVDYLRKGSKKKSAKKPAAKAAGPRPEAKPEESEPAGQAASVPATAPARAATSTAKSGIALDDLVTLKELVGRVGVDPLRKLIDVLNR